MFSRANKGQFSYFNVGRYPGGLRIEEAFFSVKQFQSKSRKILPCTITISLAVNMEEPCDFRDILASEFSVKS